MSRQITKAEEFLLEIEGTITNQDVIDAYNEGFKKNVTTLQEAFTLIGNEVQILNHTAQSILNKSFPGGDNNFRLAKAKWEDLRKKYNEAKKALKEIENIRKMFWEEEAELYRLEAKMRESNNE